nr:MAG TPA: hypothetical protein [Bacteriophage sp.]
MISACISLINALGVYWQYRQWKVPESNRPHGLLVHLTAIAYQRYTFPYAFLQAVCPHSRSDTQTTLAAIFIFAGHLPVTC